MGGGGGGAGGWVEAGGQAVPVWGDPSVGFDSMLCNGWPLPSTYVLAPDRHDGQAVWEVGYVHLKGSREFGWILNAGG